MALDEGDWFKPELKWSTFCVESDDKDLKNGFCQKQ